MQWEESFMKKNDRKVKSLKLNRETLIRLGSEEMTKAQGAGFDCTGCDSGCGIFPQIEA
jgi:hypothetical protein